MMTFRDLIHKCSYKRVFNALHRHYYYGNPDEIILQADIGYLNVYKELGQLPLSPDPEWEIHVLKKADKEDGEFIDVCLHDVKEGKDYGVDLTLWSEIIDCEFKNLTENSDTECLAHILYEITFYGFSEAKIKEVKDEMSELVKRIDSGEEKLIPFNPSELDIEE
jgi:hypothetical protein